MTLDELTELKELAAARERHIELAEHIETQPIKVPELFGMPMIEELEDVVRVGMAAEYRRRAGIAEARLRELGVHFPGDPLPNLETEPEGETVRLRGWDPVEGTFIVWLSCSGRLEQRVEHKGMLWDWMSERLDPAGYVKGIIPPLLDMTCNPTRRLGAVVEIHPMDDGLAFKVRVEPDAREARAAIEAGLIKGVRVGVIRLSREEQPVYGERPQLTVTCWRVSDLRLVLHEVQATVDM